MLVGVIHFALFLWTHSSVEDISAPIRNVGTMVELRNSEDILRLREIAEYILPDRIAIGHVPVVIKSNRISELEHAQLRYEILERDLDEVFKAEQLRLASSKHQAQGPATWFSDFKSYDEIRSYSDMLVQLRPDLLSIESIGLSLESRDIFALRIGIGEPGIRPAMLITSLMHAREWVSGMVSMCTADALVRRYDSDPEIQSVVDNVDIYIIPVLNPDGYTFSWDPDGERLWRKNRRDGFGVDLNRNWSTGWGSAGSSDDPMDQTYRGVAPFSEPETIALRDFVSKIPNLRSYIDYHSYSQFIVYPPGFEASRSQAINEADHEQMAHVLADRIHSVHMFPYEVIRGVDWYPAGGTSMDWGAYEKGWMSLTIELRPNPTFEMGFVLPPDQILPTCEENLPGMIQIANWTIDGIIPEIDIDDSDNTEEEAGSNDKDNASSSGCSITSSHPTPWLMQCAWIILAVTQVRPRSRPTRKPAV